MGADAAPESWFERWGLWSVFGVALVVVFVYWIAGLVPAAIAAVALLLTYQELPAYIWLWGNLLAALAMARAAPEGRFRRIRAADIARRVSWCWRWRCCPSCGCRCASRCIRSSESDGGWMERRRCSRLSRMRWSATAMRGRRSADTGAMARHDGAGCLPTAAASEAQRLRHRSRRARPERRSPRGNTAFGLNHSRWCSATPAARACRPARAFPPGATTPMPTAGPGRSKPATRCASSTSGPSCCSSGASSAWRRWRCCSCGWRA